MPRLLNVPGTLSCLLAATIFQPSGGCAQDPSKDTDADADADADADTDADYDGQEVFRFDTFGDEVFWTDALSMNAVVQTLTPSMALSLGLKVDAALVPPEVLASADLEDPATTAALLSLDAVVGIVAEVDSDGTITTLGVSCALCHSTVDDSVAPGIGLRLDGHPNRTLDPGRILSVSPYFEDKPDARAQLESWGPGRYDPYWNHDGLSVPVLIPPAYGLSEVALATYAGVGTVSYWNAYVAVTQMGGLGTFTDAALGIDIQNEPDLVTPKLPALLEYQFALAPPEADAAMFDGTAAARGETLFNGEAGCVTCHAGSSFTDAPTLHAPEDVGQDAAYARRTTTGKYRTTPLRGVASHPPYFHDGSAASLADVMVQKNTQFNLELSVDQQADVVAYLTSL